MSSSRTKIDNMNKQSVSVKSILYALQQFSTWKILQYVRVK